VSAVLAFTNHNRKPDLYGSWDYHDLSQADFRGARDVSALGSNPLFYGQVELLGPTDPHSEKKGWGIFPETLIYNGGRIPFLEAFADFKARASARTMSAVYLEPDTVILIRDGFFHLPEPGGGLAIIQAHAGDPAFKIAQVMPGDSYPTKGIPLLAPWG
jgi:hypothetical protein